MGCLAAWLQFSTQWKNCSCPEGPVWGLCRRGTPSHKALTFLHLYVECTCVLCSGPISTGQAFIKHAILWGQSLGVCMVRARMGTSSAFGTPHLDPAKILSRVDRGESFSGFIPSNVLRMWGRNTLQIFISLIKWHDGHKWIECD